MSEVKAGHRSYILMLMAYLESGIMVPGTKSVIGRYRFNRMLPEQQHLWFRNREPQVLLFPKSYVDRIGELSKIKTCNYNFVGMLFEHNVFPHRKWIIEFARQHFDSDSYYCITSLKGCDDYHSLGCYDETLRNQVNPNKRFVPKEHPKHKRHFFDEQYYSIVSRSKFTLCPRGDQAWSMRFFEAILCQSIPIVEHPNHIGRNHLERSIGYRYYTLEEEHVYRPEWVTHNLALFTEQQTTLASADRAYSAD